MGDNVRFCSWNVYQFEAVSYAMNVFKKVLFHNWHLLSIYSRQHPSFLMSWTEKAYTFYTKHGHPHVHYCVPHPTVLVVLFLNVFYWYPNCAFIYERKDPSDSKLICILLVRCQLSFYFEEDCIGSLCKMPFLLCLPNTLITFISSKHLLISYQEIQTKAR